MVLQPLALVLAIGSLASASILAVTSGPTVALRRLDPATCSLGETVFSASGFTPLPGDLVEDFQAFHVFLPVQQSSAGPKYVLALNVGNPPEITLDAKYPLPNLRDISLQLDASAERLLVLGSGSDANATLTVGALNLQQGAVYQELARFTGHRPWGVPSGSFNALRRTLVVATMVPGPNNTASYFHSALNVDTLAITHFPVTSAIGRQLLDNGNNLEGVFWSVKPPMAPDYTQLSWGSMNVQTGVVTLLKALPFNAGYSNFSFPVAHTQASLSTELFIMSQYPNGAMVTLLEGDLGTYTGTWSNCSWTVSTSAKGIIQWQG